MPGKKKSKLNPTSHKLSKKKKKNYQKKRDSGCMHGNTQGYKVKQKSFLIGVLDALTTKFPTDQLADNILNSKNYLTNSIRNKVVKKWSKNF